MGVTKQTTIKGDGFTFPKIGQKVSVHYIGYLDRVGGPKFDASIDRGSSPFQFKVGLGEVITGWDEIIQTMSQGERAFITCTPDYAYGPTGSPGVIPPNATLVFDIQLQRCHLN